MTEKKESVTRVVMNLPTANYRSYEDEGKQINLITFEEAITELYNDVKEIKEILLK